MGYTECLHLIRRLSGLRGYPRESSAEMELAQALQTAGSEFAAAQFVVDWLKTSPTAPYPSDVYSAFRKHQAQPEGGARCGYCDGTGMESVYELVTFGGSYRVSNRGIVGPVKEYYMTIREFMAKLPDNQEIREAARKCQCRKSA